MMRREDEVLRLLSLLLEEMRNCGRFGDTVKNRELIRMGITRCSDVREWLKPLKWVVGFQKT